MDNVDNVDKSIKIRRGHSFNENNLMVLPIFSLKKKRVTEIKKKWYRGDVEVGITVVGSARRGVPTIHELDTLMAVFRLATKSIDNKIFTFREERGKYKKLIDDGKDAYDEFKNINMEIDKLREEKSEINKRINILHNKLIV